MSDHFRVRLGAMKFKSPATLRIKGLANGVETGDAEYVDEIIERCYEQQLLLTSADDVLMMLPPLTIDRKTADRALDILRSAAA